MEHPMNVKIIWILLHVLIVIPQVLGQCPSRCQCLQENGSYKVACRNIQTGRIPSGIPTNTNELDISETDISFLSASDFTGLTQLRILVLSQNNISDFPANIAQEIPNVKEIDLSNNKIIQLHNDMFTGLTLDKVNLKNNHFKSLPENLFRGSSIGYLDLDNSKLTSVSYASLRPLKGSLKTLFLSQSAKPLRLPNNIFEGFEFNVLFLKNNGLTSFDFLTYTKATKLDLSGNSVNNLDLRPYVSLRYTQDIAISSMNIAEITSRSLANLNNLVRLSLSHNKLEMFEASSFSHIKNLTTLDLSFNKLYDIPANFGEYLSNLESLNLAHNEIESVNAISFSRMLKLNRLALDHNKLQVFNENLEPLFQRLDPSVGITLSENPLHCNCENKWYHNWLMKTGRRPGADFCYSPANLQNVYIYNLRLEQLTCRSPNITQVTENLTVHEGDTFMLTCTAEGDPAPEIHWASSLDDVITITPPHNRTKAKTYGIWQIHDIAISHAGIHTCTAKNVAGEVKVNVMVTVLPRLTTTKVPVATTQTTRPTTTTTTTQATTVATTTTAKPSTMPSTTTKTTTSIPSTTTHSTPMPTTRQSSTSTTIKASAPTTAPATAPDENTTQEKRSTPSNTTPKNAGLTGTPIAADTGLSIIYVVIIAVAVIVVAAILLTILTVICTRRRNKYRRDHYEVTHNNNNKHKIPQKNTQPQLELETVEKRVSNMMV